VRLFSLTKGEEENLYRRECQRAQSIAAEQERQRAALTMNSADVATNTEPQALGNERAPSLSTYERVSGVDAQDVRSCSVTDQQVQARSGAASIRDELKSGEQPHKSVHDELIASPIVEKADADVHTAGRQARGQVMHNADGASKNSGMW
jgi:hypothetical protein